MIKQNKIILLSEDLILYRQHEASYDPFVELESFYLKQESIKLFGKTVKQPRLSSLFGDPGISYTYSQQRFNALPWNPFLLDLRNRMNDLTGIRYNSALVNLYRNGQDSMGLHSDDERELGSNPVITSISYGAKRKMIFRRKSDGQKEVLELEHGDVLIMKGTVQHEWKHEVPKEKYVTSPRLNVTFRLIHEL
ncbi:MAG: alpha-ketoglutarate-dependent dioxygenase AlkB [Bacteroidetes bacterium]|nr:MAG: alpha-ketoglutarate-dependent dioxygenase AlkB [Bacteroidota bacterium]TNE97920.1 MAG: alpha-ketoglutarate-dependent dioxygenase AlkB [Bacteroidota bacterium]